MEISNNKTNITLNLKSKEMEEKVSFTEQSFKKFVKKFKLECYKIWDTFEPKPVSSFGNDYWEYYDRKYDNNGYLSLRKFGVTIERPSLECPYFYKFNKVKAQTFIYDCEKLLKEKGE